MSTPFIMLSTTIKETVIVNYDTFRVRFQVFFGYRFDAPKFLRKSADWVDEKSPLLNIIKLKPKLFFPLTFNHHL